MTAIVIRADASAAIGAGHVMRCLALSDALRDQGADVRFICRPHPGHLCDQIEKRGFEVSRLTAPQSGSELRSLGAPEGDDAAETRAAIETSVGRCGWLVVDHYSAGLDWERAVRPAAERMLVIDDLADRAHECDLLIDQNIVAGMETRYHGLVPDGCPTLLGPRYALLQHEFGDMHERVPPREGPVRRVLVSFGGGDVQAITEHAVSALLSLQHDDLEIDVVARARLDDAIGSPERPHVRLHRDLPSLAPLMAEADIAIGGGGTSTWERLSLGLPAFVVTVAGNQQPIAEELDRRGVIRWLGDAGTVNASTFASAVGEVIAQGLDGEWSRRCAELVDGRGAARVAAALTADAATPLRARLAQVSDESIVLEWANDPVTRSNSFSPERISAETHRRWFRGRLSNREACRFYIVETAAGVPLGQARFERRESSWEVHYLLAPAFRGRGLGRGLLEAALKKIGEDAGPCAVYGMVKAVNVRSRRLFEALGFAAAATESTDILRYERVL